MTCALVLVGVAVLRFLLATFVDEALHKPVPTSFKFPCWEGPVFLTQYLGICDSMFESVATRCSLHMGFGFMVVALVPIMFLGVAFWRVSTHVKAGNMIFEPAEHPGYKEVWEKVKLQSGFFAKFMYLRKVWNDWSIKGEWNDDNDHARR